MYLTSLVISLTVNAVVTGLIVFRILKVYWEVRSAFKGRTLRVGGSEAKVRSIIFIMIESGMAMFTIQFIRVVLSILDSNNISNGLIVITSINDMFNVITRSVISYLLRLFLLGNTPTVILIRVSMGFSFYDEKSMSETVESLRFGSHTNENSISETGVIDIGGTRLSIQHCDSTR